MLTVLRSNYENSSHWSRKEFQAGFGADFYPGSVGCVTIVFVTNPEGQRRQRYQVFINAKDFEGIARAMLEADPAAAIRAFGAAMQDFKTKE